MKLWSWHLEWSQIARAVIKDRRLLRKHGFGRAGRPRRETSGDDGAKAKPRQGPSPRVSRGRRETLQRRRSTRFFVWPRLSCRLALMLIHRVHIEGYKCLRDVRLNLAPLTVLVGPNASGKTAVLEALAPGQREGRHAWHHLSSAAIPVKKWFEDSRRIVGAQHPEPNRSFRHQAVRLDLSKLRARNEVREAKLLQGAGGNMANVFASLSRKDQVAVGQQLCGVVPVFSDVEVRPAQHAGTYHFLFQDRWNSDVWYTAQEVSDGTMLLLAYLLLPYQKPSPEVIAIEEPERGLHPFLLEHLVKVLRQLAEDGVQIVAATHSAELLDYLRPEEVRFLTRAEDGGTEVRVPPTESPDWEEAFEE